MRRETCRVRLQLRRLSVSKPCAKGLGRTVFIFHDVWDVKSGPQSKNKKTAAPVSLRGDVCFKGVCVFFHFSVSSFAQLITLRGFGPGLHIT